MGSRLVAHGAAASLLLGLHAGCFVDNRGNAVDPMQHVYFGGFVVVFALGLGLKQLFSDKRDDEP